MEFELRHAVPDDGAELLELWHGFTDYLSDFDARYMHKESADDRWLTYFENQLVDSKYGTVIVAEDDGDLIGVLEARVMGNHPIFRLENHGFINGHFVREGYRGEGVGKGLLEKAHEWFAEDPREVGFYRVRVMPDDDQVASHYRDAGFRPVEHIYEKTID